MADPVDPSAAADPVAAVLAARRAGRLLALRTSGTTGSPRFVVRTTESWWASFDAYARLTGIDATKTVWTPGPLTATMNLFAAVHANSTGAAVLRDPDPSATLTHATLTPALLTRHLEALPEGSHVIVAGDSLSPSLAAQAAARGLATSHYYGASELSFVAWGTHADDLSPFPGVEVEERKGVLWSRSSFHAEDPPLRDGDGWASVGDRGRVEPGVAPGAQAPRVRVAGRAEAAITTAGATVSPAGIEAALAPVARGRIAVIGLAHERLGQIVAAVLEHADDAAALRCMARERLDDASRPRIWLAGPPTWPLTAKGHTDRSHLNQAAVSGNLERIGISDSGPPGPPAWEGH